jgi:hypothetical protein
MEHKSDASTDLCEHCGQALPEVPEPLELEAHDSSAVEQPPLYEIRTPGGRIVYEVNLN